MSSGNYSSNEFELASDFVKEIKVVRTKHKFKLSLEFNIRHHSTFFKNNRGKHLRAPEILIMKIFTIFCNFHKKLMLFPNFKLFSLSI